MNLGYAKMLDFKIWKTSIRAQKINSFILEIFEIIIANFQVEYIANKPKFFQKSF